ncbi:hypothetical protein L596_009233 [Steinernema carpocapsae]|uniref:Uncharacterized protein n=1 Tax=Steinernema carpocapsae TaxID=34508 RepID=A0A4U5PF18_STECR|nr:hypothetical protein L596_009233 [Steinernema carpocapsae]
MADAQVAHNHHHHDEHNKRVSFGAEDQVKMIVYEEGPIETTVVHTSYTSEVGTPSKIRVTSTENNDPQAPTQILPPQQIEEIRHVPVSPPLPSLVNHDEIQRRRMEQENTENPFRPEEVLYHEVDPIVEAYRTKPYPPSNPSSPINSPIKNNRASTSPAAPNGHSAANAEEHERLIKTTTVEATKGANGGTPKSKSGPALPDHNDVTQPMVNGEQPGRVEVVHIDEKKKKCACCSIQ